MEQVTAELQQLMLEESRGVGEEWLRATQNIGGLIVMDVGPRGGGKTTKASWLVQFYKQYQPDVRRVSNVPIEDAYYVPDILKFLATKLKVEGVEKAYETKEDGTVHILPRTKVPARMLTIVDESAISGFESRGSGLSALNSYLLALSRKLNVDCELISQMMCLAKGTLIETPSGQVPIERIHPGDAVVDYTYWGRQVRIIGAVSKQVQDRLLRIKLESGHEVLATPKHRFPVYLGQEIVGMDVMASKLCIGDRLKLAGPRNYSLISSIEEVNEPTEVYDLSIKKGAPYFMANGIRSHNSMIEKRGQWLSDFYWLCEPSYVPGTKLLDHFRYRIYDEGYRKTSEFHLSREDARASLFGNFDTWDIPNFDQLQEAFTIQYNIGDDEIALYEAIKAGKKFVPQQKVDANIIYLLDKKWLRTPSARYPGDTFLMDGKRYEVLQRDFNFDKGAYQYRAREIPSNVPLDEPEPEPDQTNLI